jgi:hypothetical protein
MKKCSTFIWGALIVLLLTSPHSEAGVVIEQQVRDREERPSRVVLYYSETGLRTDHLEGGQTTIMDFKGDRMVMIDHRAKSYVEAKLSQWEKEVSQQLKKASPGIMPKDRKISTKRTGEKAVINGFQTEKIQVFTERDLIEEHWVTRDVDLKEVEKVMDQMAQAFSKEFRSELKESLEIQKQLRPFGFSILVKDYAMTHGLKPIDVLEVKKIERKELKEEIFLPPSGYERISPKPSKK